MAREFGGRHLGEKVIVDVASAREGARGTRDGSHLYNCRRSLDERSVPVAREMAAIFAIVDVASKSE